MRAVRFHQVGPPEVLRVDEVEALPPPPPGFATVEVHASGVNFADTERRRGLYLADGAFPVSSGFEGAGIVSACDDQWLINPTQAAPSLINPTHAAPSLINPTHAAPSLINPTHAAPSLINPTHAAPSLIGRRVAFLASGSAAEQCQVELARLIPLPDSLSFIEGAAFPVQALTAWHVLHTVARVRAGERVLVTAAAGGVGLLAVQLARLAGANVIGVVSSAEKEAVVREAGAATVVRPSQLGEVRDVDVLLDSVGRDVFEAGFTMLRPFGRWVTFGTSSGAPPPFSSERLLEKSLSVSGWWLRTPHPPEVWQRGVDEVLRLLVSRQLLLRITTLPLELAADAHRALEARTSVGKLVLTTR